MRQKANLLLNEIVRLFLHSYPDLRYIQALWNLGIIDQRSNIIADRFYEEPINTLARCRKRIELFLREKYPDKLRELQNILDLE